MGLTVVTHTQYANAALLEKCTESVIRNLPRGAKHVIIEANTHEAPRWKARLLDDIICFVDDDDIVINDSLNICLDAIMSLKVGLVFTSEELIDANDEVIRRARLHNNDLSHMHLVKSISTAHHLSMINTAFLTDECWALQEKHNVGIDWFMKARAGTLGGAAYVPMAGYQWRQHDSYSKSAEPRLRYDAARKAILQDLLPWGHDTLIPHVLKGT